jgi:hypothetical protein
MYHQQWIKVLQLCNGRIPDGEVISASGLPEFLEHQLCIILPQNAVSGRHKLDHMLLQMMLFVEAISDGTLPKIYRELDNTVTRVFNYRLCNARNTIKDTFGITSAMFQMLRKPLILLPETVDHVLKSVCHLHNHIISNVSTNT